MLAIRYNAPKPNLYEEKQEKLMIFFISALNLSVDDKKFLENLYITQGKRMWFVAIDILKNKEKAEDAVQSAFIKLIEKVSLLKSFNDDDKINGYVHIVIKNKSLEILRKEKIRTHINYDNLEYMVSSSENTENIVIANDEIGVLKDEISKLEPIYKEIIYMRSILELDYKDIAETFNIKIKNARGRVSYGLKKLKIAIAERRGGSK